jgi:hypothetical protein
MSEAFSLHTIANGKLQFEKLMEEVDNQLREAVKICHHVALPYQ